MDNVNANAAAALTYEAFVALYTQTLTTFLTYAPGMVGSQVYASKLADLVEAYPEFAAALDAAE